MSTHYPNAREITKITGTGHFPLQGAVDGSLRIGEAKDNGATMHYLARHESLDEWEQGIGTFVQATNTLERTTVTASSNSGSKVAFSAGKKVLEIDSRVIARTYGSDPTNLPEGTLVVVSGALKMSDGSTVSAIGGSGGSEMAVLQYRIASGNGDTTTGSAWDDVDLNTATHNGITGASLASSTATLPAGTYLFEYWVNLHPGAVTGTAIEGLCRLYDVDGAAAVTDSNGSVVRLLETGGGSTIGVTLQTRGTVKAVLASETDITLQVNTTSSGVEIGESTGEGSQAAAELKITKLA